MEESILSDELWSKLNIRLQEIGGIYRGKTERLQRFICGVLWMARSGAPWHMLPERYGRWRSVHKRFDAWSGKGIWHQLFEGLTQERDGEWVMLDATITRAHPCACGYGKDSQEREALGRSKGGFTSKIHALVDALGNPLRFRLTGGQCHDITQAGALIEGVENAAVLADKGYDSDAFIAQIHSQNCTAIIPSRAKRKTPREIDKDLYAERNLVERFFRKLKNYRRIFSRFDKKATNYLAFIKFAAILIWLK